MNELLDLKITLDGIVDRYTSLVQKEKDEKTRARVLGALDAYSIVRNSVRDRLLKPKQGMTINEAAEILNKHNGSIRRKCWPEHQYLTDNYDTRLDCILFVDGNTNTFRPYHFKITDLVASDWEEY